MLSHFSLVRLFATLWAVAPLLCPRDSPGKNTGGLPCSPPGDLPDPGIELASPMSPVWAVGFFTTDATREGQVLLYRKVNQLCTCVHPCFLFLNSFLCVYLFFWPCSMACEILVPQPGIEPLPPALEGWSLNHWTTREAPIHSFPDSFLIWIIAEYRVEFPVLSSRSLLVIYFICCNVCMSIPISQFIPPLIP